MEISLLKLYKSLRIVLSTEVVTFYLMFMDVVKVEKGNGTYMQTIFFPMCLINIYPLFPPLVTFSAL